MTSQWDMLLMISSLLVHKNPSGLPDTLANIIKKSKIHTCTTVNKKMAVVLAFPGRRLCVCSSVNIVRVD